MCVPTSMHCADSPAGGPEVERSEAGAESLFSETTAVQFDQLPEAAVRAYVDTGANSRHAHGTAVFMHWQMSLHGKIVSARSRMTLLLLCMYRRMLREGRRVWHSGACHAVCFKNRGMWAHQQGCRAAYISACKRTFAAKVLRTDFTL
jgi:hypothetical protein